MAVLRRFLAAWRWLRGPLGDISSVQTLVLFVPTVLTAAIGILSKQPPQAWVFYAVGVFVLCLIGVRIMRTQVQEEPNPKAVGITSPEMPRLPPRIEDKRSILNAIMYVMFQDWNYPLRNLTDRDQLSFLNDGAGRLEDAATDGELTIYGRESPHGRHIPVPKEDWRSIQINRLSLFPAHGGPTETQSMGGIGGWSRSINQYYDLLVRQSDMEQLFPAKREKADG